MNVQPGQVWERGGSFWKVLHHTDKMATLGRCDRDGRRGLRSRVFGFRKTTIERDFRLMEPQQK